MKGEGRGRATLFLFPSFVLLPYTISLSYTCKLFITILGLELIKFHNCRCNNSIVLCQKKESAYHKKIIILYTLPFLLYYYLKTSWFITWFDLSWLDLRIVILIIQVQEKKTSAAKKYKHKFFIIFSCVYSLQLYSTCTIGFIILFLPSFLPSLLKHFTCVYQDPVLFYSDFNKN